MSKTELKNGRIAMVPEQKRAWFVITVCVAALIAFLVSIPLMGRISLAGFALCALWILEPLLFRKRPRLGEVNTDERDKMIAEKALLAAGASSYVAFILAAIIPWAVIYIRGSEKLIHVDTLPHLILAGAFVFFLAKSVTTLFLYGREPKDVQN